MKIPSICSACGAELPASISGGLCPACLLGAGLEEIAGDEAPDSNFGDEVVERPGDRIGPYELLEGIGEGGFGMVFRAVQRVPVRREVAIKVMKPGMDSREVIARFEAERQALALMEHSHIAKVHDAGTTPRGRPFFVMELVDGLPLTTFCDRHRLPIKDRLELFCRICSAIQHAHQKGVIHRDLKPGNILVIAEEAGRPRPKVIDFGVAKAVGIELTEQSFVTHFGRMLGTPEYMSPEQSELNATDVDTRSDIYSLGVILYESLCGRVPMSRRKLTAAGFNGMCRIIREEEPPKPSTRYASTSHDRRSRIAHTRQTEPGRLERTLKGDLDWIVMKALEKEPDRRYDTVNGMAADIRRYLRNLPVQAGPPSTAYRVGKFVRRNRGGVAVVSLIVIGLITGIIATSMALHSQRQATREIMVASARSARQSGESGWMQTALDGIAAAAKIRVGEDLRNEALAVLAGTDMEERLPGVAIDDLPLPMAYDAGHRHLAIARPGGRIEILETKTWRSIGELECPLLLESGGLRFGGADQQYLLVFSGGPGPSRLGVYAWKEDRRIHESEVRGEPAVDLLPHHRGLAIGTDRGVEHMDWEGTPLPGSIALGNPVAALSCHPLSGETAVSLLELDGTPHTGRLVILSDTGRITFEQPGSAPGVLAWDPTGGMLAIGNDDGGLTLLHPGSRRPPERLEGHQEGIRQITWSTDGLLLASSSEDLEIRLHDRAHQTLLSKHKARPGTLSFSPHDQNLTLGPVAWNGSLINLGIRQPRVCHHATGHFGGGIRAAAWNLHTDAASGLAFSTTLATAGDDGVRLWNRNGRQLAHLTDVEEPCGLNFSGEWFYQCGRDGLVRRRWSLVAGAPGRPELDLGPPETVARLDGCRDMASAPDGKRIAVAGAGGIWLVDPEDPASLKRIEAPPTIHHVAIDGSGRWLAGTLQGQGVTIWSLPDGEPVVELPLKGATTVAFSPDLKGNGPLLAAGDTDGNAYRFWEVGIWNEREDLKISNDMAKIPGRMAFSPRGTAFVVSHSFDQLMVLDPRHSPMKIMTRPNFDKQWPLATSREGMLMATEGWDGRLFIWDLVAVRHAFQKLEIDWEDLGPFKAVAVPLVDSATIGPAQPQEKSDNR